MVNIASSMTTVVSLFSGCCTRGLVTSTDVGGLSRCRLQMACRWMGARMCSR